jgi:beta-galactosidase
VTLWTVAGARLWSPETPTLYTVELELLAADDAVVDAERQRVGLRVVAIRDGILMLNGRRLVVRGVNRHEWNPWRGRAVTEADMRADIVAMKRLNFNAVRTCHYPDTERWYELCDELGMAVVDEANLETHGLQAHLSRDPLWAGAYLERVVRMVLRDRNHACVVVWSLGNESFFGPGHAAMAAWVRQADPSRPVQYESGDPGAAVSDIRTPMYPGLDWVRQVMTDPADRRPMIMCEYAYAKGNSTGNVREFWDLVWEQPRFQGGFVWDWADKSLVVRDAAGAERHRYGTPGGESDGVERMCLNGVVGPDLVPHPGAYELKLHQSPVWLVVEDAATGRIRCHNRHHTLSLGHLALVWRLHDDGLTVAEGRCALPELVAGTSGVFNVDVPPGTPAAGATRWLDLRVVMVSATAWCPAGHEILATQARIGSAPAVCVTATGRVESAVEADGVLLTGRDWSARIDRAAGALTALRVAGRDLITRPFGPCLHRAPTDIDLLIGGGGYAATWAAAGLDAPVPRVHDLQVARASDNLLLVRWHGELALRHGHIQRSATWTIGSDGDLVYEETLVIDAPVPTLGRIGLEGSLSGACDQWRWVGRGPFENYPDRKDAALIGDHRLAVRDNLTPYIFPQECGLRCDVSWMALTAVDGSGLLVQGQPLLHASALPVRRSDLAAADNLADLVLRDDVAVHLDGFHQGLGGDTGWTRNVHAPYLLPPGRYRWSVRLRPLRVGEDPAHLGRSAMPGFPR